MPIRRRTSDDEECVKHFEDFHTFNPQTTVWIPHPCEDEKGGTFAITATDFELDDMLSDYEVPTPFADHREQIRQTAKHAILQEENDDISAGYVQIFSSDDDIENAEYDDEDSNLVEYLGPTFKPTLQMAGLVIPPKNDEHEDKMRTKWRICRIRRAKINILMNEGLSRITAAIQADMAFEKQARGKGRDPEIAEFLLEFNSDQENASNPQNKNEEVDNGLTSLISEDEPNEHKWKSWCKTCGHTSGEIAKFATNEDILTIEEKEDSDAFRTWWMRLLVANGLTKDEAEEQLTEFCAWAVKKHNPKT